MAVHEIDTLKVSNGVVRVGDIVSAESPEGAVIEGRVVGLQPYGHDEVDPTWAEDGTVLIKDHEDGHIAHWRPSYVTKLNTKDVPTFGPVDENGHDDLGLVG